jgi:DNA-binding NtrC family response regulator
MRDTCALTPGDQGGEQRLPWPALPMPTKLVRIDRTNIPAPTILATQPVIEPEDICVGPAEVSSTEMSFQASKARVVGNFEQAYIRHVLRVHGGNIPRAAQSAGKDG